MGIRTSRAYQPTAVHSDSKVNQFPTVAYNSMMFSMQLNDSVVKGSTPVNHFSGNSLPSIQDDPEKHETVIVNRICSILKNHSFSVDDQVQIVERMRGLQIGSPQDTGEPGVKVLSTGHHSTPYRTMTGYQQTGLSGYTPTTAVELPRTYNNPSEYRPLYANHLAQRGYCGHTSKQSGCTNKTTGKKTTQDHTQWLHCNICDCKVNSEYQMRIHVEGVKHRKKAALLQRQAQAYYSTTSQKWAPSSSELYGNSLQGVHCGRIEMGVTSRSVGQVPAPCKSCESPIRTHPNLAPWAVNIAAPNLWSSEDSKRQRCNSVSVYSDSSLDNDSSLSE